MTVTCRATFLTRLVSRPVSTAQPSGNHRTERDAEYTGLGGRVAKEICAAIAGRQSVDEAPAKAQLFASDVVEGGGYRD
jgi:hypothetical protein